MANVCPLEYLAPDLPLAEQIRIEALAQGRRRECARQVGATVRGPGAQVYRLGERIRAIAADLDLAEAEERRREMERQLRTPSALIRTMKADWPKQSAAVQRLAKRLDVPLGQAWSMTIAAGVKAIGKRKAD